MMKRHKISPTYKEQLKMEKKQAKEQLEQLMKISRPKNFREGVASGVGNVIAGVVGGVGLIVVAPLAGSALGYQTRGFIGATTGLLGGTCIGVLGGTFLVVGGSFQGVTQVVRGVVAIPETLTEPPKGKWYSHSTGSWVSTDLSKISRANLPDNDDDLLKKRKKHDDLNCILKSSRTTVKTMPVQQNQGNLEFSIGRVRDTYYYDILEVDCNASYSVIERQCYELARMYHPDKLDSISSSSSSTTATRKKEAEILFKEIAEAYQVLGDPKLREQ